MELESGQARIRNLVLGPGTVYDIQKSTNYFGASSRFTGEGARVFANGSWKGPQFLNEHVTNLYILIKADDVDSWQVAYDNLMAAFRPLEYDEPIEFRWRLGASERVRYGAPVMVEPNLENISVGKSYVQCAFVANDPTQYSGTTSGVTGITLPVRTGGLTIPYTIPYTIDTVIVGGSAELVSNGTKDTPLHFTVHGPVVDPRLVLNFPDGSRAEVGVLIELDTGDTLDIDSKNRTVMLNDAVSRRGQTTLTPMNKFPYLPPGVTTVSFIAAEHSTASLDVAWSDAYH